MKVKFVEIRGKEISSYVNDLAELRIKVFSEFPYLYEGTLDYERKYLETYQHSKKSLIVLAFVENQLMGATTCIPMLDESEEFQRSFLEKGIHLEEVFYFGESIILKEYRGQGVGHQFFKFRENYAKAELKDLKYTTFCAVDRPMDHPLKPPYYRSLDEFWQRLGYVKQDDMKVYYSWKDIDREKEDLKSMTVWLKTWK